MNRIFSSAILNGMAKTSDNGGGIRPFRIRRFSFVTTGSSEISDGQR